MIFHSFQHIQQSSREFEQFQLFFLEFFFCLNIEKKNSEFFLWWRPSPSTEKYPGAEFIFRIGGP